MRDLSTILELGLNHPRYNERDMMYMCNVLHYMISRDISYEEYTMATTAISQMLRFLSGSDDVTTLGVALMRHKGKCGVAPYGQCRAFYANWIEELRK